ncbi:LpxL/LpxP family Kdo(2)-lipid IV(A) lauroyl/palmitoleoyl acyltransferase [Paraglaciecola sp. 2405UD69-4]|uniref:LpxL/LpxP family Kdo(2)-lipid IV(A) lauroyl/palmitoleoyl acyltransferase n=1 Tax=Paraglaciecola sp. 2405UD69-4 TaxID=3391836 RepID=UPI0039C8F4EA
MQQKKVVAPEFELSFLGPKYWPTWFSVIFLYCISWLPYSVQKPIGKLFGKVLKLVAKKRYLVAKRNIELCFPDLTPEQRAQMLKENLDNAGMALLETGMGWWWPDWRVKKMVEYDGVELIDEIHAKGKGVLGYAIHNMNIEFGCRMLGIEKPSVVFYRKHNNPLMEYMQYHGRNRANKYMIHKRNVKGLIQALDEKELCLYLPDQDYGRKKCEFTPFFAVPETATTTGSLLFASSANCETVFFVSIKTKTGYKVKVLPGLENFPSGDDKYDVARINQMVEKMIMLAPEQYLWMHKRFKTRPNVDDPSLYD